MASKITQYMIHNCFNMHVYAYVHTYIITMSIHIGITPTKCQRSHLTSNIKYYQDHLKCKYDALELVSPHEMLDCFSPQYIDLILIKVNQSDKEGEAGQK